MIVFVFYFSFIGNIESIVLKYLPNSNCSLCRPSKIKKDEPSEEEDPETGRGEAASSLKDDAPKENKPDNGGDGTRTPVILHS